MNTPIDDQVVDFYYELFGKIFSEPFRARLAAERRKRDTVVRQVEESASAASGALSRFFVNRQLSETQVADFLAGYTPLAVLLRLDDISNTNIAPQSLADDLLGRLSLPSPLEKSDHAALYRLGLLLVVRTLAYVAPVMAEWQRLNFSQTFEFPRRITDRLNQIGEQVELLGRDLSRDIYDDADARFDLLYRDYLIQRFLRIEAGTVRMTTNLDVDLRELFVMPRVRVRAKQKKGDGAETADALMDLSAARRFFGNVREFVERTENGKDTRQEKDTGIAALEQVTTRGRNVIIGAPGGGKSTFLEWLQLRVAYAEVGEGFLLAGKQAIPILLRVRELELESLPQDAEMIRYAAASRDLAGQMPDGWLDRQMRSGRVIFMLDGLDETEPDMRDRRLLPWLQDLCKRYTRCRFLVSSRPAGYPPGTLRALKFDECELLDFDENQIALYTANWCTAVRLARNEPDEEARREGAKDGTQIVEGFKSHPYIRDLARNPLMLSAICLVNYFEGGQLPKDRAVLYRLCVEGLLHNWDQRRGIHTTWTLDEKLRVCRELAIEMQTNDLAEYEAAKVLDVLARVLGDRSRAEQLLEHIRHRTGLLIERRAGVFAFAHLTFQEYLAALAVHEGNAYSVDTEQLVHEHNDGRWGEVIALYCGLVPTPAACNMLEGLLNQHDSTALTSVLGESYLASSSKLLHASEMRESILERIAILPLVRTNPVLAYFPTEEVAPVANRLVGKARSNIDVTEAHYWLYNNPKHLDTKMLGRRLRKWRELQPNEIAELLHLLHAHAPYSLLHEFLNDTDLYLSPGPKFAGHNPYRALIEVVFEALDTRSTSEGRTLGNFDVVFTRLLEIIDSSQYPKLSNRVLFWINVFIEYGRIGKSKMNIEMRAALISVAQSLMKKIERVRVKGTRHIAFFALSSLADKLKRAETSRTLKPKSSGGKVSTRKAKNKSTSTKRL